MSSTVPKISCSLLSFRSRGGSLEDIVRRISNIWIDMIHYDVTDEAATLYLADLPRLMQCTPLPFDVHLAVHNPREHLEHLRLRPIDSCSLHVENRYSRDELVQLKRQLQCQLGLAVNVETPSQELDYALGAIDYVLFMAARPGLSAQSFDQQTIQKIRDFKQRHPEVPIHVDGGIDDRTAVLVRDVGVDVLISGSYILKDEDHSAQVAKLIGQNLNLPVTAIMHGNEDLPAVSPGCTIAEVAKEIDRKKIGCTCVVESDGRLAGLITDTDIRRYLIKECNLSGRTAAQVMNAAPRTANTKTTIIKLLRELEDSGMVFSVVPVMTDDGRCIGVVRLQDVLFRNILGFRVRHL